jgi:hypothetical protein
MINCCAIISYIGLCFESPFCYSNVVGQLVKYEMYIQAYPLVDDRMVGLYLLQLLTY